jgi:hypothetical protein
MPFKTLIMDYGDERTKEDQVSRGKKTETKIDEKGAVQSTHEIEFHFKSKQILL